MSARYQHEINSSHPDVCHLKKKHRRLRASQAQSRPRNHPPSRGWKPPLLPWTLHSSTHQLTKTAIGLNRGQKLIKNKFPAIYGDKACKLWDPLGVISLWASSQTSRGLLFIQTGFTYKASVATCALRF